MTSDPRTYVLCPGYIISRTDGQMHHVGAAELKRLYGVRPEDRTIIAGRGYREVPGDVMLLPRNDGAYYDVHEQEATDD
jgi:hypothetical protein